MEDSFNVRVDKIFGSLNSSSSPSSSSSSSSSSSASAATSMSSLWRLTDAEIPKREWRRGNTSTEPQLARRVDSMSDVRREYCAPLDDEASAKSVDCDDQYWEVKSSIGLDCTLDYEEEEDEYDKVAVDDEDRMYMRDVEDNIDFGDQLPLSFQDPRANHLAAKLRLKEDDEAANKIFSLRVSDETTTTTATADGALNPKSILKRKDNDRLDNKSHKRVRFDPLCVHTNIEAEVDQHRVAKDGASSGVPDYLLNPNGYTRYTLDSSSEVNEDSNKQAHIEFLRTLGESRCSEEEAFDPWRSVTFVPRKKRADNMIDTCTSLVQQVGIAATPRHMPTSIEDAQEDDVVCGMEEDEDEPETVSAASKRTAAHKSGRQYRTKPRSESDD